MQFIFIFLLAFISVSVSNSGAQPVLTIASTPSIGDEIVIFSVAPEDSNKITNGIEGAAGANVTWDLSALVAGDSSVDVYAAVPSQYAAEFSNAQLVSYPLGSANTYTFHNKKDGKYGFVGFVDFNTKIKLTDPLELRFPFTYGQTQTDNAIGNLSITQSGFSITGTQSLSSTATYDAYGTLKTPFGTYTNVARIKTVLVSNDTIIIGPGIPPEIQKTTYTRYAYFREGDKAPLAEIEYSTTVTGNETTTEKSASFSRGLTASSIQKMDYAINSFQLYPNPAHQHRPATITFHAVTELSADIQINTLTGQKVYAHTTRLSAGYNTLTLPTDLSAGLYIVTLTAGGRQLHQRLVIQ